MDHALDLLHRSCLICVLGSLLLGWFVEVAGTCRAQDDSADPVRGLLQEAITSYQQALGLKDSTQRQAAFRNAEIAFSTVMDRPQEQHAFSADLFVNWGNAATQINDLGKAVLAYRRALIVEPFHAQAQRNLDFVRSQLPEWTQEAQSESSVWDLLVFWNRYITSTQLDWLAAILFVLACFGLGVGVIRKSATIKLLSVAPILGWLTIISAQWVTEPQDGGDEVVFVATETECYTADSGNSPLSFSTRIPAGTEARLLEERIEWSRIEVNDGKQGWVPRSSIQKVQFLARPDS